MVEVVVLGFTDLTGLTDSSYKYIALILDFNVPDSTFQLKTKLERCPDIETRGHDSG